MAADIGRELHARGWRQGSLLSAASARLAWLRLRAVPAPAEPAAAGAVSSDAPVWALASEPLADDECLVIVTQTCDLTRAPDAEPYVEALRAYWTRDKGLIHAASWNSVRTFLLRRRQGADGAEEGLIADATCRVLLEKAALLALAPEVGVEENDPIAHGRFRRWLAQRYGRRAIDDALVAAVQRPVVEGLRKLRATDPLRRTLDAIREVRYVLHNDTAPYAVEFLLIPEERAPEDAPLDDESLAALAGRIAVWLEQGDQAVLVHWGLYPLTRLSAYDYLTAYPLPLDHYSESADPDEPPRGVSQGNCRAGPPHGRAPGPSRPESLS
jgi:hypothetical protein